MHFYCIIVVLYFLYVFVHCIPGSKFDANDDRSVEQNKSIDEPSKLMW